MKTKFITFLQDRVTKNTIRFQEQVASDLDSVVIGTLYVQKTTLAQLGYKEGNTLIVQLEVRNEK